MNAPAIPSGVLALMGDAVRRQRAAEQSCLDVLIAEGFEPVLLPVLEYEQEGPGAGYRFVDRSGHVAALRTDFTPLAARMLAPTLDARGLPLSICYAGEVVRPRPHRLRQLPELYQLGFERYGVERGAARSLELTLQLLATVGVAPSSCHLTVSMAGLAEQILARLLGRPPDDEAVELMRVRDLDRLRDLLGVGAETAAALAAALFGGSDGGWPGALGVGGEVASLAGLLETAAAAGVAASIDVAPRLAGAYYRGAVFALWGRRSLAVIAGGGDYEIVTRSGAVPASGACLTLGVCLEEAAPPPAQGTGNPGTGYRVPGTGNPGTGYRVPGTETAEETIEAGGSERNAVPGPRSPVPGVEGRGMLTVALPKSRLLDQVVALAETHGLEIGPALRAGGRALVIEAGGLRLLLLKDADVPVYVEQGIAACGIAGLDQVLERDADVLRVLRLPFGHCRLCLIAPDGRSPRGDAGPLVIASKFPRLAERLAAERGLHAHVIPLAGSVELAASLGLADFVVDLVETGRTLRENGLHLVEEWLHVAPYLIANRAAFFMRSDEIRALRRTLGGEP
jgi:ATP phosphoribosyltransferase